jgi:hypothetical protein
MINKTISLKTCRVTMAQLVFQYAIIQLSICKQEGGTQKSHNHHANTRNKN